jgi:hypothetical protein
MMKEIDLDLSHVAVRGRLWLDRQGGGGVYDRREHEEVSIALDLVCSDVPGLGATRL